MLSFVVILTLGVFAQQTLADEPEGIVGGRVALKSQFPYQCSLNINNKHWCGCSIINKVQVLSAAHCVNKYLESPYTNVRIVTGTVHNSARRRNLYKIKTVRMHPDYKSDLKDSWVNDIAIITVTKPIKYNNYQSPIALPTAPPIIGSKCVLVGWGRTRTDGPLSNQLYRMNTTLIDRKNCSLSIAQPLYETHVCAFNREGIGACEGDSGGPLVCNDKQVGITSFAHLCATGTPDVYTNVYHHLDFIREAEADM